MPVLILVNRNPSKSNILIFFVKKMRMQDLSESYHFITVIASRYQLNYTVMYDSKWLIILNRHFIKIIIINIFSKFEKTTRTGSKNQRRNWQIEKTKETRQSCWFWSIPIISKVQGVGILIQCLEESDHRFKSCFWSTFDPKICFGPDSNGSCSG